MKEIWILYTVYLVFSAFPILYHQDLRSSSNVLFRHLNGFVGFYMVQAFFHDQKRIKLLLSALILAGLFPIGIGTYQAATGSIWRVEGQEIEGIVRNVGLYHDAITIRHYAFQTILALLLYLSLHSGQNVLIKAIGLFYIALATMVMARAYSKAGMLLLLLWGTCWTVLQKKVVTFALLIGFGLCVSLFLASDYFGNILTIYQKEIGYLSGRTEAVRTFNGRWYIWQEMYLEWDKLGWLAKLFGSGKVALGAHNDYLQMLFHGGVIGLLLYLVLLTTVGSKIVVNVWRKVDPFSVAALLVFLSWLVDTIGLVPSAYSGYQWFVWGIIGLSFRLRTQEQDHRVVEPEGIVTGEDGGAFGGSLIAPAQTGLSRHYPLLSG